MTAMTAPDRTTTDFVAPGARNDWLSVLDAAAPTLGGKMVRITRTAPGAVEIISSRPAGLAEITLETDTADFTNTSATVLVPCRELARVIRAATPGRAKSNAETSVTVRVSGALMTIEVGGEVRGALPARMVPGSAGGKGHGWKHAEPTHRFRTEVLLDAATRVAVAAAKHSEGLAWD